MSVQFYGYNFGGTSFFHISAIMHSFRKLVADFGDLEMLCGWKIRHWIALDANECEKIQ